MFYIKEFFKLYKENIILSTIFILSTTFLISGTFNYKKIQGFLSLSGKTQNHPYFNALVTSGANLDGVARKVMRLPGVVNVKVNKKVNLDAEISDLKSRFGTDVLNLFAGSVYKQMKVELEKGINTKNQSLIREYLLRLVGSQSVTLSSTRKPRGVKLKKNDSLVSLLKFGDKYLFGLLACLWLISGALLMKPIQNKTYIIEKFQRREYTNIKLISSGLLFFGLLTLLINVYMAGRVEIYGVLTLAFMLAFAIIVTGQANKKFTVRS